MDSSGQGLGHGMRCEECPYQRRGGDLRRRLSHLRAHRLPARPGMFTSLDHIQFNCQVLRTRLINLVLDVSRFRSLHRPWAVIFLCPESNGISHRNESKTCAGGLAAIRIESISCPVEMDDRHAPGRMAGLLIIQDLRRRYRSDRRDPVGQFAGQPVHHDCAVRKTGRVNPARVNIGQRSQFVD